MQTIDLVNEGNRLIAESPFSGLLKSEKDTGEPTYYYPGKESEMLWLSKLTYHSSWDSLKPVIDEIFKYILACSEVSAVTSMSIVVGIIPAWAQVVKFIKWYNNQKK